MALNSNRSSFPRMAGLSAAFVLFLLLTCGAFGQAARGASAAGEHGSRGPASLAPAINWGPSVTSLGFGGSQRSGAVPPSVTSLGFGSSGSSRQSGHSSLGQSARPPRSGGGLHHHPERPVWGGYYPYPVIGYGAVYEDGPDAVSAPDAEENPDEYRGGPTIFDRRGNGEYEDSRSYSAPEQSAISAIPEPAPPAANQPQTLLVFKDGHHSNVGNYAIVGNTLYDLTGGMRHKIPLADLDLTATAQQNDERGVDFELPAGLSSN